MKKFKRLGTLFLCATLILSFAAAGKVVLKPQI